MINLRNFKNEIENMAKAAKLDHQVQVGEMTEAAYTKLFNEDFTIYNIEHQMGVDVVMTETSNGSYIIVVGEKH